MTIEEAKKSYEALKRNEHLNINIDKDFFFEFAEVLFDHAKQMGKGQKSLIDNRRKWKRRYYNERRKVKELKRRCTNE